MKAKNKINLSTPSKPRALLILSRRSKGPPRRCWISTNTALGLWSGISQSQLLKKREFSNYSPSQAIYLLAFKSLLHPLPTSQRGVGTCWVCAHGPVCVTTAWLCHPAHPGPLHCPQLPLAPQPGLQILNTSAERTRLWIFRIST